jgi:hypothetical protein
MASTTLGRTDCPLRCADPAAHVKLKTDKATTAYPYVHCRGCGCQLHTKNEEQAKALLAITRAAALDTPPAPTADAVAPEIPTPTPTPTTSPTPRQEKGSKFLLPLFGRPA